MTNLPNQYDHLTIEKKWQEKWFTSNVYHWNENASREQSYVIDTPPPTVSGLLHMGHIFSYTQADFIARYKRMRGFEVFYPIGFDDNGLPTEKLVEKSRNIRGSQMSREEFIKICEEVVKDAEEEFRKLFKSAALSFDWRQEYQTISPTSRKISQLSFIDLYNKNLVYRSPQPTLWDPSDQTALAQADIVDQELKGYMHHIIFKDENNNDHIIATSRPELLPACGAVLAHPDDARFSHLKGKHLITPLFNIKVPVIFDDKVEMEKGSGLVMCCTFGDITDIQWWRKHNLPLRQVINRYGKLTFEHLDYSNDALDLNITKKFLDELKDLKVKDAKVKVVTLLTENNLLQKSEEVLHVVKCAERSGTPLEILITEQWSVKIIDHKEELLKKSNECTWYPEYMKHRMDNWINGLNWDWCISRQRFFGVPFPAWYSKRKGEEGKIIIADTDQLPVDPFTDLPKGYSRDEVEPDKDVMDTWATSSVTPQLNSLAINKDLAIDYDRHTKLYSADLRPQAHEIIRTWAFYTLVKSHFHENSVPWKNLMISGWCLAADKTKMSKSKGNVVTPVNLIEEKGADVVRYWASNSRLGADIAYSEEVFKIGRKLINKVWNAAKFSSQYFEIFKPNNITLLEAKNNKIIFNIIDLWMLSKLKQTVELATKEFENYEYSFARTAIEDFFWNVFCDNYLEIVKTRAYNQNNDDNEGQKSAISSLYFTLNYILKLFAPFIPHITEELYSAIYNPNNFIHAKNNWPNSEELFIDDNALVIGENFIQILAEVRRIKAENNLSLKTPVKEIIINVKDNNIKENYVKIIKDLQNVTQAEKISFGTIENMIESIDNSISFAVILT
ncbi:MAG: valine--tRNA ligase [Sphingobacteriia bacterium]|nr:valine--tRNA ligase [Sphingobacteriia bacterium]